MRKTSKERRKQQEILLCVVNDFLLRKDKIQYDQKSMDRVLELTPRRRKYLPPEAATSDYTLYLDCSSFCFDAYYQAFGYELESDLTWHMADFLKSQIFYYERTFCETELERKNIAEEIQDKLEIGDLIVLQHKGHSGHVMLYVGNGKYVHCRPKSDCRDDSYDYEIGENHDVSDGALQIDKLEELLYPQKDGQLGRYYLFSDKETRIAIARPLDNIGQPTNAGITRRDEYRGLYAEVIGSKSGGKSAENGELIRYTLKLRNTLNVQKNVHITYVGGKSYNCNQSLEMDLCLEADSEKELSIVEPAKAQDEYFSHTPEIIVNSLPIYVHPVLIGNYPKEHEQAQLSQKLRMLYDEGMPTMEVVNQAYADFGLYVEQEAEKIIQKLFYLHDSTAGDVLSRKKQNPKEDMALYSFFGGKGVVTPQMCQNVRERTTRVKFKDLITGDIILCCDDALAEQCYAAVVVGDDIIGELDSQGSQCCISGKDACKYVDSLFSRFCFVILRPWLSFG